MAKSGTNKTVWAALAGNLLVAATKFVAAAISGSAAMLSEAVHSLVDTLNELLLLYGIVPAARPCAPLGVWPRALFLELRDRAADLRSGLGRLPVRGLGPPMASQAHRKARGHLRRACRLAGVRECIMAGRHAHLPRHAAHLELVGSISALEGSAD